MARRKWRRAFGPKSKPSMERKVEKVPEAEHQEGMSSGPQLDLGVEGSPEAPRAKQARMLETPKELQESQLPKPDGSADQLWEMEFQEFLENSVWEQEAFEEQPTPWAETRTFLASFEQVAIACRWPRKEWVTRLLPALSEEAEKAFVSMEAEDRGDFSKVKVAILHWEAVAREKKRQEFRRFCYQEAEGPREVYARLQELCSRWLDVEKSTKEHLLEMVIVEQFLNVLPKEMQSWVRGRVPETGTQAIKLAEEFLKKLQTAEIERAGQQEQQEVSSLVPQIWKPPLEMEPVHIQAKKELYASTAALTLHKAYPDVAIAFPAGFKKTTLSKMRNFHWGSCEEMKLRTRFPGRMSAKSPYPRKHSMLLQARRRSERLQKTIPPPTLSEVPPSSPLPPPPPAPADLKPKIKKSPPAHGAPNNSQIKNCPECGRDFNGLASFRRHWIRHSGEKRYECCFCGRGFCWRSDLVRHECLHTGKKPHECTFCGEGFDLKWQRVQHEQMHMGGKARL